MNMDRDKFKEQIEKSLGSKYNYHYSKLTNSITRMRVLDNRTEMSYLDYFITANIVGIKLEIMSPIGQSDHFPIQIKFETNQIGELYIFEKNLHISLVE